MGNKAKVMPSGVKDGGSAKKYADKKGKADQKKEDVETLSDGSERGNEEAGLIDPNSGFMRRWDLASICMLLFVMFVTPFEVAYLSTTVDGLFVINRLVDVFFICDMVIQFFLMYRDEEKGVLIKKQGAIIRVYMKGWFWIDLIAILPFDMIGVIASSDDLNNLKALRIARLLRLFKLLRILRAGRMFDRWESSMAINYSVLTLCKFVALTIVVAHWLACLWHMTVNIEDKEVNWVTNYGNPADSDVPLTTAEVYVVALYWAVMTMSTIGYGDVGAVTTAERITATFGMFIGSSIFAYIVGAVTSTVATMGARQTEFYELMDSINLYMDEVGLPQPARIRIREYFRHRYNTGSLNAEKNFSILEFLSPALQEAVATHTHASWIRDISYFASCPDDFVTKVAMRLRTHTFAPHEVIIHLGEEAANMFIVKAGVCAAKGVIFTKGKVFGDDMVTSVTKPELVSSRGYQARALTFSDVYDLPKEALEELLNANPMVKEMVRKLAIKYIFRESVLGYNNAVKNLMTGTRVFNQDRSLVELYENKLARLLPRDGEIEDDPNGPDEMAAVKSDMIKTLSKADTGENAMGSEAELVIAELVKLSDSLKNMQDRMNKLDGGAGSPDLIKRIMTIEAGLSSGALLEPTSPSRSSRTSLIAPPPPEVEPGQNSMSDVARLNQATADAPSQDPSLDWAPQSLTTPQAPKSMKSGMP
jgi:potassium voltage-gated channel Eag-related subfamily H protein 7